MAEEMQDPKAMLLELRDMLPEEAEPLLDQLDAIAGGEDFPTDEELDMEAAPEVADVDLEDEGMPMPEGDMDLEPEMEEEEEDLDIPPFPKGKRPAKITGVS